MPTAAYEPSGCRLGTTQGQNSARGGIFDHWGLGLERSEAVLAAVRALSEP